ncbi:hypothetical protein LNQ49_18720 [Flavobacterium sp. F-65]|jgi:hypothetical protein|uniref:Replication restart DNA helicase PriA n=1 Tax=Flavobacterium pisciphilum TaxID=2893755 RepID=A0ABS8MZM3_9FLAO|nr:hypothetical protein [Flavobacterium sp. F-65]MCC9073616.1 hypothetical protein [Flavobacterium sp. F-65]
MKRFQDENKFLGYFSNEVLVQCPKCDCKSAVKREKKIGCECGRCFTTVFECKHCFYRLEAPVYQYIAYGKAYCNHCFEKYEFESQPLKECPEKYRAKCPHCSFQEEWKPKIKKVLQNSKINDGLIKEEWYNLPLWFQKEVDGNVFWAYNQEHIDYLERYIGASLRERNSKINYSSSLVSRLPKFVKEAKNREKLLKIIEKWKK